MLTTGRRTNGRPMDIAFFSWPCRPAYSLRQEQAWEQSASMARLFRPRFRIRETKFQEVEKQKNLDSDGMGGQDAAGGRLG